MSTLPVSSHPPELLEAQPSQIDEVFVKISPAEDKPKVAVTASKSRNQIYAPKFCLKLRNSL